LVDSLCHPEGVKRLKDLILCEPAFIKISARQTILRVKLRMARGGEIDIKSKIVLSLVGLALMGTVLFGAVNTFAQNTVSDQNPMSSLVQKIADKFGLNKDEVQAVFDQNRQEHQAQMQTRFEDQLTQDVKDGKITEAQKQLTLTKRQELQANRQTKMESMRNMTNEERKVAMEKERQETENWAKENGIDLKYLMGGLGGHRGFRGEWK